VIHPAVKCCVFAVSDESCCVAVSPLFRFQTAVCHLFITLSICLSFFLFSHPVHLFFVSFRPLYCTHPCCGECRKAADQISAGVVSSSTRMLQTLEGAKDVEVTGRCTYAYTIVLFLKARTLSFICSDVCVLWSLGNCEVTLTRDLSAGADEGPERCKVQRK
jgi:hypothetical protein